MRLPKGATAEEVAAGQLQLLTTEPSISRPGVIRVDAYWSNRRSPAETCCVTGGSVTRSRTKSEIRKQVKVEQGNLTSGPM
jgi:hypothetical protein